MIHFFLMYHQVEVLNAYDKPPQCTTLHLDTLDLPQHWRYNEYAESRGLKYLAQNMHLIPEGWIGLFQASYSRKFARLPPLHRLIPPYWDTDILAPVVLRDFLYQAQCVHPGMEIVLSEFMRECGVECTPNRTIATNSWVIHSKVLRFFLPIWEEIAEKALEDIAPPYPWVEELFGKPRMSMAYFLERITTAWLSAQKNLHVEPLRTIEGDTYQADHPTPLRLPHEIPLYRQLSWGDTAC